MNDRPGSFLKEREAHQFNYQTNLTEEQYQKHLDFEKEFQSYDRVNSLCNEKINDNFFLSKLNE